MAIIYQPVVHAASDPYRGAALVGTHSAVIGWTFDDLALRDNLLGFAIRRTDLDPATGEVMRLDWLGGFKRFADSDDGRAEDVDSLEAPFQRFRNQHPSEVGPAAYHWLSRGLKESLLGFIAAAEPGDALHVAIYEFFDHEIAQAFKDAVDRQVDVRIVHDAKPGKHS